MTRLEAAIVAGDKEARDYLDLCLAVRQAGIAKEEVSDEEIRTLGKNRGKANDQYPVVDVVKDASDLKEKKKTDPKATATPSASADQAIDGSNASTEPAPAQDIASVDDAIATRYTDTPEP